VERARKNFKHHIRSAAVEIVQGRVPVFWMPCTACRSKGVASCVCRCGDCVATRGKEKAIISKPPGVPRKTGKMMVLMTWLDLLLRKRAVAGLAVLYLSYASFNLQSQQLSFVQSHISHREAETSNEARNTAFAEGSNPRCAINIYGLPRAFKSLVLPSIVKNVIQPNARYGCDYFVHYYEQTREPPGRSGSGGSINAAEILSLKDEVKLAAIQLNTTLTRMPTVTFAKDSELAFWKKYHTLIHRIRTSKDVDGKYIYFPWKDKTYQYPVTTDNIIKMWHSIQASWNLMEEAAKESEDSGYSRVAMLRADVVYVTPIDIFERGDGQLDIENKYAVVPAFCRFPVSDRLVYGPYEAVKVWAAERFSRMERHVSWVLKHDPGYGLHSERFVNRALFPAMRSKGVEIIEHPTMCFFRVRADESVWITDCKFGGPTASAPSIQKNLGNNNRAVVESLLGRKCWKRHRAENPFRMSLDCGKYPKGEGKSIERTLDRMTAQHAALSARVSVHKKEQN